MHGLLPGHLIQQLIPHGGVKGLLHQVNQPQAVVSPIGGILAALGDHLVRVHLIPQIVRQGLGHQQLLIGLDQLPVGSPGAQMDGAFPVLAAHVDNAVVPLAGVGVDVRKPEGVLDGQLGLVRVGIGGGVQLVMGAVHQICPAFSVHPAVCVRGCPALEGQQAVHGGMGVMRHDQLVVTRGQHIGACAEGVVGAQVLLGHLDLNGLLLTGLQLLRLAEFHQLDGGHLDPVLLLIIAVGLRGIDLHRGFAGCAAGVGDVDLHDIIAAVPGDIQVVKPEIRVGETIAEGVGHNLAVLEVSRLVLAVHIVLIPGLGILVPHVHAFLIHDVGREGGMVVGGVLREAEIAVVLILEIVVLVRDVAVDRIQ